MAVQREAIFEALFARIQGVERFQFTSRVFQSWDDTPPSQSPAAFMIKGSEKADVRVQGLPLLWELTATLVVYVANDPERLTAPSVELNHILTDVEAVLERKGIDGPSPGAQFPNNAGGTWGTTLGGLCYGCQINGTVEVFEGVIAGWSQAIVPIQILTTG